MSDRRSSSRSRQPQHLLVADRFMIGKKIGSGSFGSIYLGKNTKTGSEVAIKLESSRARHPQLFFESRLYHHLKGGIGIPRVKWFGIEGDYNVLVMELLGPSLEDLFNFCHRKFSLKTVLMLADQMLRRIEYMHSKNYIHRDLKPDNFLMGLGEKSHMLYLIDFGLAKRYRDNRTHRHIMYRENKSLTGTARYASIYTHLGIEQSRRDDLESLGYILMYFCRGALPWQGLKARTKQEKYDRISDKKMCTSIDSLCKGFPSEFATYLNYTRSLRFADQPDYAYLRRLFRDLFIRLGFKFDFVYDWAKSRGTRSTSTSTTSSTPAPAAGEDASKTSPANAPTKADATKQSSAETSQSKNVSMVTNRSVSTKKTESSDKNKTTFKKKKSKKGKKK